MRSIRNLASILILVGALSPLAHAHKKDPFTSTDWLHVGFNLPDVVCGEGRPGCVSIDKIPTVVRLEAVRWRYDRFQLGLFKLFAGESWAEGDIRVGGGILGMGQHWRLNVTGTREWGWLFWLLFFANESNGYGALSAQVYYRTQMSWSTLEVGIESTLDCCTDTANRNADPRQVREIYPHTPIPVHLYLQAGF